MYALLCSNSFLQPSPLIILIYTNLRLYYECHSEQFLYISLDDFEVKYKIYLYFNNVHILFPPVNYTKRATNESLLH